MAKRTEAASIGTIWAGIRASIGIIHWLALAAALLVALPEVATPTVQQWTQQLTGAPAWLLAVPVGAVMGSGKGLFVGVAALLLAPRMGLTAFPSPGQRTGGWMGWALIVAVTAILQYLAVALATMFLVIPGIIVGCMLFAALPAVALEKTSAAGALSRSAALTQDYRFGIFGMQLVIGIPVMVISAVALLYIGSRAGVGFSQALGLPAFTMMVSPTLSAVSTMVSTATAVAFYVRRALKTSAGAQSVAAIFD
jgi:hypothetical protein